jgi:hypothetical protein
VNEIQFYINVPNKYDHSRQIRAKVSAFVLRYKCFEYFLPTYKIAPERKKPLGRPRHRWEDGIRMDLREIGWESVEWMMLAQDRNRCRVLVNTVMNLRVLAPRS